MPVKIEIMIEDNPEVLNGMPARNVTFNIDGTAVGQVTKLESWHANRIMTAIRDAIVKHAQGNGPVKPALTQMRDSGSITPSPA